MLALAAGWLPAGARAAPGMEFGLVNDEVFLYQESIPRHRAFELARELGITRLRVGVHWNIVGGAHPYSRVAPRRVRYDFRPWDWVIDHAAEFGIRVQLTLTVPAPAWATANRRMGGYRPSARAFAAFAYAAARHFRGRVDRYSILNEPNFFAILGPAVSCAAVRAPDGTVQRRCRPETPFIYRSLYRAAHAAIKRADPRAEVLIGELSPYAVPRVALAPLRFLRLATCTNAAWRRMPGCAPLLADGLAIHPYDFFHPPFYPYPGADNVTIGTLGNALRATERLAASRALVSRSGAPVDLHLTEFGYASTGRFVKYPQLTRALFLHAAFDEASRTPRVRQMSNYGLVAPPPAEVFDTALTTRDGRPLPAYRELRFWARRAAEDGRIATLDGPLRLPRARALEITPTLAR